MSRHQSRATSLEEKGATPIHRSSAPSHKSSTPTHKSASSSSSSQRDSRQRFFVLDNGILKYSKSPVDVKSPDVFDIWVFKLRHHRLFRQNEIVRSPRDATLRTFPPSASAESPQNTSSSANQNKVPLSASMSQVCLHASNPNLCVELADFQTPVTRLTDSIDSASDYIKLQEDFCIVAQKVHSLLKSAFNTVAIEKEKIKQVLLEQEQTGQSHQIITLRRSLSQALSQNAELKTRLNRIHSESVLSDQVVSVNIISSPDEAGDPLHVGIPLSQQVSNESRLSMSESVSEFFDAQE
ncbi:hypothetical protein cypCar_00025066, partial [Cyprinus carpio]